MGETCCSPTFTYRVSHSSIVNFVLDACEAICRAFQEKVMAMLRDEAAWHHIATDFKRKWNMSHYLGAIDIKHVAINL